LQQRARFVDYGIDNIAARETLLGGLVGGEQRGARGVGQKARQARAVAAHQAQDRIGEGLAAAPRIGREDQLVLMAKERLCPCARCRFARQRKNVARFHPAIPAN